MLRLLTGGVGSEKSDKMFSLISNAVKDKEEVLIIVPDQFSFEYDKKLYKNLGAKLFNSIKVVSFSRLAETIIKQNGSQSGEYADDNTKQIIMYLAIKEMKSAKVAKYYKKQLDKPNFIGNAIELVKDLRQSEIAPEQLSATELDITGSLFDKVSDIDYLYSTYCRILKEKELKDSLTIISEAAEIAKSVEYFSGLNVFVDEFNGFSSDEISMLEIILSQAENVSISLTIGSGNNLKSKLSPFSNVIKTEQQLIDIAKKYNLKLELESFKELTCYSSKSISYLSNNIFYPLSNKSENSENVEVIACNDLYEEIEYISAEIKRLVCKKGYKYSEIAIISRQLSDYYSVISGAFERYEIPYFMDTRQPVSQKALILYVMSIFEAVTTRSFNTENILKYIKSTLSKFNDIQVSKIEDYCYQWNVNGNMWLEDFTAENSEDKTELSKINKIRSAIIEPLQSFKNACTDATAEQICRAVYSLVNDLNLSEIMSNRIKSSTDIIKDNETQAIEIAREFKQLWGILISAIKSIYNNLRNEKTTLKEFYELLKQMLFQSTVATPPQKLDAVTVASAERSKLANPKVVFVIGVNEGIMPYNVKESGLFTDKDKEVLEKSGVKISRRALWKFSEESFIAYQALSLPSEKLYVSYPLSDLTGGARRPSVIIKQLLNMFGDTVLSCSWDKSADFFCTTVHSAYYKFIESYKNKSIENESIKSVLLKIPQYKDKINFIENSTETANHFLSPSTSQEMFFSKNFSVSPTRIESYNKCAFNFFCENGLKLQPTQKVEINPLKRGTIVHYCLENIMSKKSENGKNEYKQDFLNFNDDEIRSQISDLLIAFKEKELGGDFGKTSRFDSMFHSLENLIFEVVKNIRDELSESGFVPKDFEVNLTDENGNSIFELETENGFKIVLRGKIDRIDVFEKDGKKYTRIIDYKTRDKELSLSDIYHGINLQMILYLMAVTQYDSSAVPMGVFYMPAIYLEPSESRNFDLDNSKLFDEKKITDKKKKELRKKGLIIRQEDDELMNSLIKSEYIHIKNKAKSDGYSDIFPSNVYKKLEDFAKEKLIEMSDKLASGNICAIPTGENNKMACKYCNYWSVCGNYMTQQAKIIKKSDADKLRDIIGIKKDGEAGENNECNVD